MRGLQQHNDTTPGPAHPSLEELKRAFAARRDELQAAYETGDMRKIKNRTAQAANASHALRQAEQAVRPLLTHEENKMTRSTHSPRTVHPALALWRRRWMLNTKLGRYQRPHLQMNNMKRKLRGSTAPMALLHRTAR